MSLPRYSVIALLLAFVLAGCSSGGSSTSTELNAVMDRTLTAFRDQNSGYLGEQFTADVQLIENGTPIANGREMVAVALTEFRRQTMDRIYVLEYRNRRPAVSGDNATMTGQLYIDADFYCFGPGGRCREQYTEDWVFTFRRSNGRWLISKIERTVPTT